MTDLTTSTSTKKLSPAAVAALVQLDAGRDDNGMWLPRLDERTPSLGVMKSLAARGLVEIELLGAGEWMFKRFTLEGRVLLNTGRAMRALAASIAAAARNLPPSHVYADGWWTLMTPCGPTTTDMMLVRDGQVVQLRVRRGEDVVARTEGLPVPATEENRKALAAKVSA